MKMPYGFTQDTYNYSTLAMYTPATLEYIRQTIARIQNQANDTGFTNTTFRGYYTGTTTSTTVTIPLATLGGTQRSYTFTTDFSTATDAVVWSSWVNGQCVECEAPALYNQIYQGWAEQQGMQLETRQKSERAIYFSRLGQAFYDIGWAAVKAKQAEEAKLAKVRARKLLIEHLSKEQRKTYEKHNYFIVVVGKTKYRIDPGTSGNVRELDAAGKPKFSYCIHPSGVPEEDVHLSQKLLLETDEAAFKRIANRSLYYS